MIPSPGPMAGGDFNSYVALLIRQVNDEFDAMRSEISELKARVDKLENPPAKKGSD